jgi:hypothetical protein
VSRHASQPPHANFGVLNDLQRAIATGARGTAFARWSYRLKKEIRMIRHASAVALALACNATPLFGQSPVTPITDLIVKAPADVHKFPSVASPIIGKAPGGTVLEIRRNLGSWVEVSWPSTEAGIAFMHVVTGAIVPRPTASASNTSQAQAAVADIAAVAAAATALADASARAGVRRPVPTSSAQQAEYVSLPQHRIGIGALMNVSNPVMGATARTWWENHLGVQFSASRPQHQRVDGQVLTSTLFSPSLLYSLPDRVANGLWLRPYIGAGPRFYRANQETRLGYEALGGAEATIAAIPQFALSADVGYRWSRASFDGFELRQIGFSLAGHWYLK